MTVLISTAPKVLPNSLSVQPGLALGITFKTIIQLFFCFTSFSALPPTLLVSCLLWRPVRHRRACLHGLCVGFPAWNVLFWSSNLSSLKGARYSFTIACLIFPKLLILPAHICSRSPCLKMLFPIEKLEESRLARLLRAAEPAPPWLPHQMCAFCAPEPDLGRCFDPSHPAHSLYPLPCARSIPTPSRALLDACFLFIASPPSLHPPFLLSQGYVCI